jgi:hypothetical protein
MLFPCDAFDYFLIELDGIAQSVEDKRPVRKRAATSLRGVNEQARWLGSEAFQTSPKNF